MKRDRSYLGPAFIAFAIVALFFVYRATEPVPEPSIAGASVSRIEDPAQETANALELTKIALQQATATATPTMVPTRAPTTESRINWCGTATPGATCEVPPYPTPTITPYPDCAGMANLEPKSLCQWK